MRARQAAFPKPPPDLGLWAGPASPTRHIRRRLERPVAGSRDSWQSLGPGRTVPGWRGTAATPGSWPFLGANCPAGGERRDPL